ncbi:MAG TPA: M14 family metallopeptidase, partial [Acidimicrobiia bacterium]|nr:M14 family metallopeptidase [Acidimicrobiia bacterium]
AAAAAAPGPDLYRITAPPATVRRLAEAGFDVAATRADGTTEIVAGPAELARLEVAGLRPVRWRDPQGRTVADLARAQAARMAGPRPSGSVWKHWSGPGGLEDEVKALAAAHPDLVQTELIGRSVQGRDLLAVRVTGGVRQVPDGARPAVLYLGLQHAREWISGEVTRRFMLSMIDTYGTDPETTKLLDTTELWFLVVANPDGYELTFSPDNRLWRKNVADNDGDGQVTLRDGVDLNRNLPDHWASAPQGSSNEFEDQTFRGKAAASEPETQALVNLAQRLRFRFIVNYHSFARLLLYPIGWQEQTPTADQSIYAALAGTPVNPAIPGYKPELSAALYSTNGETTSWAHAATGSLAFTVELGEGLPESGFVFPDNEALVEQEYELNRPFALDVALSAVDPAHPVSHLGNTVAPFAVDRFSVSYGDPQPVQATVVRALVPAELHWQINGGAERHAPTSEWAGGRRYGATGAVWEHRVRGSVTGAGPGDQVTVWFTAGNQRSESFTYRVEPHKGAKVLVVVGGEHERGGVLTPPSLSPPAPVPVPVRTAAGPAPAPAARLAPVLSALAANGVEADTYDVEAHGHRAPDPLGVLGHYPAVIWTADEERRADSTAPLPETVSRLANDEMLAARAYLNEGGRLLYMGRDAGRPYTENAEYDPVADGPCPPGRIGPLVDNGDDELGRGCVPLSEEFFQYWLGAYDNAPAGGNTAGSSIAPVDGVRAPFDGLSWAFEPGLAPGRNAASYSASAEKLGRAYPDVLGRTAARYRRPGPGGRPPEAGGAGSRGAGIAAAVETDHSLLFGFGFEDIASADQQAEVMARALSFLLPR